MDSKQKPTHTYARIRNADSKSEKTKEKKRTGERTKWMDGQKRTIILAMVPWMMIFFIVIIIIITYDFFCSCARREKLLLFFLLGFIIWCARVGPHISIWICFRFRWQAPLLVLFDFIHHLWTEEWTTKHHTYAHEGWRWFCLLSLHNISRNYISSISCSLSFRPIKNRF